MFSCNSKFAHFERSVERIFLFLFARCHVVSFTLSLVHLQLSHIPITLKINIYVKLLKKVTQLLCLCIIRAQTQNEQIR